MTADALALTHAELSRVEAQLRTVLDTSSDGIALYDTQLCYQYLNAAARRAAEDPYWDFLGRTDRELGRDEAFLAVWEASLKSVLATGEDCAVDFSLGSGRELRWFAAQLSAQRETEHGPRDRRGRVDPRGHRTQTCAEQARSPGRA